jgi:hypothetical protein
VSDGDSGDRMDDVSGERTTQALDAGLGGLEIRNDHSGRAHAVVQAGRIGQVIQNLPPPLRVRPHQVPSAIPGFANQVRFLAGLHEAIPASDSPAVQILVCHGPRGAGKTAIVRQFAPAVRDRFPGGQLFVDYALFGAADGTDGAGGVVRDRRPGSASDALATCLRGLDVPDEFIPVTLPERAGLFRTRSADAAMLVVLDDVRDPEQVRWLIPNSPGSVVLVTGDAYAKLSELLMDGAKLMEVKRLSTDDAVTLMSSQCGSERLVADPEASAELVRLCDGLPVALRVAATRLTVNPQLGVADLVCELADERQRLSALSVGEVRVVDAVFTTSYRNLPAAAARMYAGLGLLPGPEFTAETAAIVAEMSLSAATDAIQALVAHHLIEQWAPGEREPDEETAVRWRVHGLVRSHAAELARLEETSDPLRTVRILRRVVEHYLRFSAYADHAVMGRRSRYTPDPVALASRSGGFEGDPFKGERRAGLEWLDRERANLLAVQDLAVERGWDTAAWQLAETMTALFFNRRYLNDWSRSGRSGAEAAERDGRLDAAARLWCLTSRALVDLGEVDQARGAVDRALHLGQEVGDRALLGSIWEFRGRVLDLTDPEQAAAAYEQSVALNLDSDELRGAALARFFLGQNLDRGGSHAQAVALLQQAFEEFAHPSGKAEPDLRMAARVNIGLGVALSHLGQTQAAIEALEQAVAMLAAGGLLSYEAQALEELAAVRAGAGDADGAKAGLQRAAEICARFANPRAES